MEEESSEAVRFDWTKGHAKDSFLSPLEVDSWNIQNQYILLEFSTQNMWALKVGIHS